MGELFILSEPMLDNMATKKKVQMSVTLNDDQIAWIDKHVNENRFATRSHAIVYAISHLMKEEEKISEQGNYEAPCLA